MQEGIQNDVVVMDFAKAFEPCQANLCLREFRHDKF